MKSKSFFILAFVLITACAPPPSRNGQTDASPGTAGDPGGGGIGKSTKAQVLEAIDDAMTMFKTGTFTEKDGLFKSIRTLTENLVITTPDNIRDISIDLGAKNQSEHKKNIEMSKIYYDMSGCPGVQEHKHAAVSDHKLGANLCFNVSEIQKLPPSQLSRELLALIAHEYFHLLGHRELEAQAIQKVIVDSWPKLEFFQHFKIQFDQVKAFSDALTSLNQAGLAVKKNDQETAKKRIVYTYSKLEEVYRQTNQICSGFLIKVGNREALLDVNMDIGADMNSLFDTTERIQAGSTFNLNALGKYFCRLSKTHLKYQKAIYRIEEFNKIFGEVEIGNTIQLNSSELAFECPDIPKETFDLIKSVSSQAQ